MSIITSVRLPVLSNDNEHIEQENFEETPSFLLPHVVDGSYISFNKIPSEFFEIPQRDPKSNKIVENVAFSPLCFRKTEDLKSTINNIIWSKYINEIHFVCPEDLQEKIQTWPAALNTVYFASKVQLLNQINVDNAYVQTQARWDDAKGWIKTTTVYNLPKNVMNGVNKNNLVKVVCPHE
jgi:hypothetical protein